MFSVSMFRPQSSLLSRTIVAPRNRHLSFLTSEAENNSNSLCAIKQWMTWDFVQLTQINRSDIMSVLSLIRSLSWLGLSIHNWVVTPSHHFGAQWPLAVQRSTSLLLTSMCFVSFLSYITASSNVSVEPNQDKKHLLHGFFSPFLALTTICDSIHHIVW